MKATTAAEHCFFSKLIAWTYQKLSGLGGRRRRRRIGEDLARCRARSPMSTHSRRGRWSTGRLGTGLILPTALLETRGARTGELRRNAVIYFRDDERVTIIASKLGLPEHPAYNLRATRTSRSEASRSGDGDRRRGGACAALAARRPGLPAVRRVRDRARRPGRRSRSSSCFLAEQRQRERGAAGRRQRSLGDEPPVAGYRVEKRERAV